MKADRVKYILATMLLVSGLSTVYFGNRFLDLQTGGLTVTLAWFEYKEVLIISFIVFFFTTCYAAGLMVYEIIRPAKAVKKY